MTPKTKIQKACVDAYNSLPPISKASKEWAKKHLFKHRGYRSCGNVICLDCGKIFKDDGRGRQVCPHCGASLDVEQRNARRKEEKNSLIMQIITTTDGWQAVRNVDCTKYEKPNSEARYTFREVICNMYHPSAGKQMSMARNYNMFGWLVWDSEMSLKEDRSDAYTYWGTAYPNMKVLPILRRNGFTYDATKHVCVPIAIRNLMYDSSSRYETLIKLHQYDMTKINYRDDGVWAAMKIVFRNDYHIKEEDMQLWVDMVEMMYRCGIDVHNAKNVCPSDIKAEHDRVSKINNARIERLRKEQARESRKKLLANNEDYVASKGKFFGLEIKESDFVIAPLKSIQEFFDEGDSQHICVGHPDMHYWNKDSLIMSARTSKETLATIEVSLDDFTIRQCYAACNKIPTRDSEIRNAINNNMNEIRRIAYANR